jgi:hypothetical protein
MVETVKANSRLDTDYEVHRDLRRVVVGYRCPRECRLDDSIDQLVEDLLRK